MRHLLSRKISILTLFIAIALQALILVGMVASAALPLWTGTEVKVKTTPIDPRSLFRGNYAMLRYNFSQIDHADFQPLHEKNMRKDEVVYVTLVQSSNGLYEPSSTSIIKPDSGVFIRGRISNHFFRAGDYSVKYGIEAFFAPKEKALKLERELRYSGVAVLMISKSGRARIKEVIAN